MFRRKSSEINMVEGPLFSSIVRYSVPLMIGSLIQVLFNAADLAVLGNMADKQSVAAVGATGAIVGLLVNTFVGISAGSSIVMARQMGENDFTNVRKTIDTSMVAAAIVGVVMMVVSILLAEPFLKLTNCPDTCFEGAKIYLLIYFAGIPAIMIYNFGGAILRTGGDSRSPLNFLIISGILNVILNIVLCLVIKEQKVIAVAVATLASQILGAFLTTVKLLRSETIVKFYMRHPKYDRAILGKVLKHGIPCGFSNALYCIANMQIQSAINAFGDDMIAGNSAAANVEVLVCAFTNAFAVASFTFIGQNVGADKKERVGKTIKICMVSAVILGLVLGIALTFFGKTALSLFIPGEEKAIEYGLMRMKFILAIYFIAAMNQTLTNILQGFGKSMMSTIINVGCVLVFRFIWMTFIYPLKETPNMIFVCYSISWTLCCIALFVAFFIVYGKYKKGQKMEL